MEWHWVKKTKISKYRNLVIFAKLSVSVSEICLFHISLSVVSLGKIKLKSLYVRSTPFRVVSEMILALFDARTPGPACTEKSCSIFVRSSFTSFAKRVERTCIWWSHISKNTHGCFSNYMHMLLQTTYYPTHERLVFFSIFIGWAFLDFFSLVKKHGKKSNNNKTSNNNTSFHLSFINA